MRMFIFLLLGAQVDFALMNQYLLGGTAVVLVMMFVARPVAVFLCAGPDRRAKWSMNELLFMCWTRETGVIPAALAGLLLGMKAPGAQMIASVTLFVLWFEQSERELGNWKYLLLALMVFLSFMMFSRFSYPSFKAVNWKTKRSIPRTIAIFLLLVFTARNYAWMPAILFISYLLYGFFRPFLSLRMRREFEDDDDDRSEAEDASGPAVPELGDRPEKPDL